MNKCLSYYYSMNVNIEKSGYFYDENKLYYVLICSNPMIYLKNYHYYLYYMKKCQFQGFRIVLNIYGKEISQNMILFQYENQSFSFFRYLDAFLVPYGNQTMKIKDIKEYWIRKIDTVKEKIGSYSYSFKFNADLLTLTYYYCGLGENSISVLNEILSIYQDASVFMGYSLRGSLNNHVYEILNPTSYVLSSRCREVVCLYKSHLISLKQLKEIIEKYSFHVYEILYLYAHFLYPFEFYDDLLDEKRDKEKIQTYLLNQYNELKTLKEIAQTLNEYVSIPKIDWINNNYYGIID